MMDPQPRTPNSQALNTNVNVPFINGVVIVIFAGGGFRADVCKQVYIGGSGDNNNGVVIVKFFRPGIENFTENGFRVPLQRRLFS